MNELPNYLTVVQTAEVLGTTTRRIRSWQQLGVLPPAARKGLLQYRRADVIRAAVLRHLQTIFGEGSALAVELAKSVPVEQLEQLLAAPRPRITATATEHSFQVELDPDDLVQVRERLASVPV